LAETFVTIFLIGLTNLLPSDVTRQAKNSFPPKLAEFQAVFSKGSGTKGALSSFSQYYTNLIVWKYTQYKT
jgi:hypothetical protein